MSAPTGVDLRLAERLAAQLRAGVRREAAIALDFDGVCMLFTEHKHQILSTCLFLHLREFQRVPFRVYREAYREVNFRSREYAGRERLLCAHGLARHLAAQGYACALPGLHAAVEELLGKGLKISAPNLAAHRASPDVARALDWSREVDEKVAALTEIGLTPGLRASVLDPFREQADFYVVSTATESSLPGHMQREGVDFILRYLGQETATKAEALSALARAGYRDVFLFGDSVEDERASARARDALPPGVALLFVPVIPGDEEASFAAGRAMIEAARSGDRAKADRIADARRREFQGKEVAV